MSTISTAAKPRQLRLVHLFIALALAAVALAIGAQFDAMLGIALGFHLIAFGAIWNWRASYAVLIPLTSIAAFWLLMPNSGRAPIAARRMQCSHNLKQLMLALHNYHDVHHQLPPAVVKDQSGKPLYSWRVLLLPYLEQEPLYRQFHLDEPWDSPHNSKLARQLTNVFSCPGEITRREKTSLTNYVAIVGDETLWPDRAITWGDVTDGTSATLAIVEWAESDIVWSEPRDLAMDKISPWWNTTKTKRQGVHRHSGGVHVAWGDGRISHLQPHGLSAPDLRAILTRNGNDAVREGALE